MKYLQVILVVLFSVGVGLVGAGVIKGCNTETPEQNFQRRLADMSTKPYIEEKMAETDDYDTAMVVAIFDDLPRSAQVRVVVRRFGGGLLMTALHPRCAGLVTGQEVKLTYVDYKSTEVYMTDSFYINE